MKHMKSYFVVAMLGLGLSAALVGSEQSDGDQKKAKGIVGESDKKAGRGRALEVRFPEESLACFSLDGREVCKLPWKLGFILKAVCSSDKSVIALDVPKSGLDCDCYVVNVKDSAKSFWLKDPYLKELSYRDPVRFASDDSVYVIYTQGAEGGTLRRVLHFFPKGSPKMAKEVVWKKGFIVSSCEQDDYDLVRRGERYELFEKGSGNSYEEIVKFTVEETPAKK